MEDTEGVANAPQTVPIEWKETGLKAQVEKYSIMVGGGTGIRSRMR